jgi:hypothetical protein
MLGGMAGGFLAKKALDTFVEDDAVYMFQIFKEEYLDCIMQSSLSQEEFNQVSAETIASQNLQSILQNMFQSGEPRRYAREIMDDAISLTLAQRQVITEEIFDCGYMEFGSDIMQHAA